MANRRIAVIGSANVDLIMKLPKLPAPGETVTDGEYMQVFGGKGANTAVAAARAGGDVAFAGCVGDDHYGRTMLENFARDGIDASPTLRVPGKPCGTALIFFDAAGENVIGVAPGTNDDLTPERVRQLESLIAGSAWVLLQMEIPPESNREVLKLAERHGTKVLFNYAPVRGAAVPVGPAMTVLVVNGPEASELSRVAVTDAASAREAAAALRRLGPELVVLTLGAEGALAVSGTEVVEIPAFPVTPVDTTAAGDTFCGCLGVALAEGCTPAEAVRFACAAAAVSVTRAGAQPSIPKRAEIEAML